MPPPPLPKGQHEKLPGGGRREEEEEGQERESSVSVFCRLFTIGGRDGDGRRPGKVSDFLKHFGATSDFSSI